jgi:hypothetical protein
MPLGEADEAGEAIWSSPLLPPCHLLETFPLSVFAFLASIIYGQRERYLTLGISVRSTRREFDDCFVNLLKYINYGVDAHHGTLALAIKLVLVNLVMSID